ncbi:MAG: LL-diaminopimelate aminotransferase [Deltaproteobacteria bacterium]|jgi:LL-diaminopimelate aminotransferase|nr:LL-diaminopimelate aminotransferase [Deltaproteobacteria bacterium]
MTFEFSERLKALPPYLFKELDRIRDEVKAKGVDIIDLGVGDPDRPTPPHIIEALKVAAEDKANHQYPVYSGMNAFREVVARVYKRRYNVDVVAETEVCSLIGSKEGLAQFPLAFLNPGDVSLVPEPSYPVYRSGTLFAGGVSVYMPLLAKNGFLPDLGAIEPEALKKAKIIWVNYPNNPTGAAASLEFYAKLVEFAKKHSLIVASDAAYSDVTCLDKPHPSVLEVPGGKDVAVEFHSLSKTYNMTGWRIGWAVGNATLIKGLGLVKSNVDSGVFQAVQLAGMAALEGPQDCVKQMGELYRERRGILVEGLKNAGIEVLKTDYTFYVWASVPKGLTSADFASKLLNQVGIVTTPGNGFGPSGEGYVRFALVQEVPRLKEAAQRLASLKF